MLDLRSTRNWTRPYIYIYISCTRHNPNSSLHRYLFPRISLSEACNMKTYKYVTSFSAYELWSSPIVVPSLVPFSLRSAVWTWFSSRHSFVKRNLPKANSRSWGLKSRALIIDRANLLIFSIVYIYIYFTHDHRGLLDSPRFKPRMHVVGDHWASTEHVVNRIRWK